MRWLSLPIVALSMVVLGPAVPAQGSSSLPAKKAAIEALVASVEMEAQLLEDELTRYRNLARRRGDLTARVSQFYQALEAEAGRGDEAVPERLDQLLTLAQQAEGDLALQFESERTSLAKIRDHLGRLTLADRKLEELRGARDEELAEVLSGTWDLVLLPLEQRGTCELHQTGAVVAGTYRLDGGYSGSLQGTLVNRKVYLLRIDSRMGKMMEFEGFLSNDGNQIRGSWLNYELAGSEGSTGQWVARRRPVEP